MGVKETYSRGGKQAYKCAPVSFQSTSLYNISTVNSVAKCKLQTQHKVCGRGYNNHEWSIKINHDRSVYLATYFKFYLCTTLSKIVEYFIDHGSFGIHQCSMQNPLQLLSHTTSTRIVHRVGLIVSRKLNTQLTSGNLEM